MKGRYALVRSCAGLARPFARASLIFVLLLSALFDASAHAGISALRLKVAGRPYSLKKPVLFDGREVYIPLEALRAFDAGGALNAREDAALVSFPGGGTAEIAIARPGGIGMLPFSLLEPRLRAELVLTPGECDIRPRITRIALERDAIRITASFAFAIRVERDAAGHSRIELIGASGAGAPAAAPAGNLRSAAINRSPAGAVLAVTLADGFTIEADSSQPRASHLVRIVAAPRAPATLPNSHRSSESRPPVEAADSRSGRTVSDGSLSSESRALVGPGTSSDSEVHRRSTLKLPGELSATKPGREPRAAKPTGAESKSRPVQTAESPDTSPAHLRIAAPAASGGQATKEARKPRRSEDPNPGPQQAAHRPPKPEPVVTRLEIELPKIQARIVEAASRGTAVQRPDATEGANSSPGEAATGTSPAKAPPGLAVTDVSLQAMDAFHARLQIKTTGKTAPTVKLLSEPSRLAVDIPNCAISTEQLDWACEHPFLTGMHVTTGDKPGTSRVVLDLARLVGYKLLPPTADGIAVNLMLPRGVGRKLSDLIIVVDPGHGGPSQTGCSAVVNGSRVYEKNLTLSIAGKLRQLLEDAGANVMLTRTQDREVSLSARPGLANENNADLFVSIHVDDCGIPNSASGSTAYYHMDDESSRALAHTIIERVAQVSGLPNRGARSDRVRFVNGMAVLRYSTMPAVLVETAYINNSRDRQKLLDPNFQQKMAQAIFDGIRTYAEGALPEDELAPLSRAVR